MKTFSNSNNHLLIYRQIPLVLQQLAQEAPKDIQNWEFWLSLLGEDFYSGDEETCSMMELNTAWELGSALGLGVLIGMERQRTRRETAVFAGVRTFALVVLATRWPMSCSSPWMRL